MECATILYDKKHYFPMHVHPNRYTFSYILNGSANLICSGSKFVLKTGDLVVIPPYLAHQTLIDNFFHYRVIRVPKMHAFNNVTHNRLGLTIIQNSYSYKNHFNNWFESIKINNSNSLNVDGSIETEVPEVFKRFLINNSSNLIESKISL